MERYEALCVAIGMLDAAMAVLEDHRDDCAELEAATMTIRNDMNAERNKMLGNGTKRPWSVCELMEQNEAET